MPRGAYRWRPARNGPGTLSAGQVSAQGRAFPTCSSPPGTGRPSARPRRGQPRGAQALRVRSPPRHTGRALAWPRQLFSATPGGGAALQRLLLRPRAGVARELRPSQQASRSQGAAQPGSASGARAASCRGGSHGGLLEAGAWRVGPRPPPPSCVAWLRGWQVARGGRQGGCEAPRGRGGGGSVCARRRLSASEPKGGGDAAGSPGRSEPPSPGRGCQRRSWPGPARPPSALPRAQAVPPRLRLPPTARRAFPASSPAGAPRPGSGARRPPRTRALLLARRRAPEGRWPPRPTPGGGCGGALSARPGQAPPSRPLGPPAELRGAWLEGAGLAPGAGALPKRRLGCSRAGSAAQSRASSKGHSWARARDPSLWIPGKADARRAGRPVGRTWPEQSPGAASANWSCPVDVRHVPFLLLPPPPASFALICKGENESLPPSACPKRVFLGVCGLLETAEGLRGAMPKETDVK